MINFRYDRARQSAAPAIHFLHGRDLAARIERSCATAGITPSRFGRDAVGDPALVADLMTGRRNMREQTRVRVLAALTRMESGKAVRHA
ncbi:hypothetical protein [Sphingobium sp. KCTC 72723]|uniref:hypothetical protein n=1 Tax=Sphingobium sp. KCTC 72723 TaxID=2733867 RepID=UPI0021D07F6C|nr:hypothetical protein [Sphingobium sp. KCTC 72723]